jgi:hypothetical protein
VKYNWYASDEADVLSIIFFCLNMLTGQNEPLGSWTGCGMSHNVVLSFPFLKSITQTRRHEPDHSLLFNVDIKNGGAVSPLLHTSSWIVV